MRRIVVALGFMVTAVLTVSARPAAAHFCAFPVLITPGHLETVNIGVAAETTAVVDVLVRVPSGFRVDHVIESPRWTTIGDGTTVEFTDGRIESFECGYFSVVGVAERGETLVFPLTIVDESGTTFEYTSRIFGDPYAAQIVYVDTERAATREERDDEGSPRGPDVTMFVVAAALVAALIIVRLVLSHFGASQRSS